MNGRDSFRRRIALLLAFLFTWTITLGVLALSGAIWPDTPGDETKKDGDLYVDCSNMADGYIAVKGGKSKKKLKIRIACGDDKLTYDINKDDDLEIFPLQFGNGKYTVTLYKNIKGKQYSEEGKVKLNVELSSKDAPFLCPNQYVLYTKDTEAVQEAEKLCANCATDKEVYNTIHDYVVTNFVYDYMRALNIQSGALPDIDYCFTNRMGICQDLSAMTVCMLRSQGVPAKLVIGYADKNYHAWVSAKVEGEYVFFDPTAEANAISKDAEYTVERVY